MIYSKVTAFPAVGCNSLQNASAAKEAIAALHFFSFCMHEPIIEKAILITQLIKALTLQDSHVEALQLQAVCCMFNVTMFLSRWGVGERKHWLGAGTWE